ncbi:12915_t:CDS:2 [Entrophospora sp. SA101]|nr:15409_t:CDS:2 [Entrophospora sp. SA101]CAJ0747011.1 12915_t:CDS:2 [Entrophospora sp. SA101]CAJ0844806.1 3789_t:CDS:2 [Entrophospora sp. SA101]CAJ0894537.1 13386_t:CDS:2 [Entrophospora sp. SA101]
MRFSIIYKSSLERTFRVDAEFYKPDVLKTLSLLSKKQPLTNYVKVSDGNHSKITEYFQDYPGIPYYGGKDISAGFFIENARPVYIPESKYNQKQMTRSHFLPGDILLTTVGIVGNLSLITDTIKESTGARSVGFLRPSSELSSEYIASFLMSKYGSIQLKRIARGSVQVRILLEDFDQIQLYPCSSKFNQKIKEIVQLSIKLNAIRKQKYYEAEKILSSALDLNEFKPRHQLTFTRNFSDTKQAERCDAEYFQPKFDEAIQRIKKSKNGYKYLEDLTSLIGHPSNPPCELRDIKEKTKNQKYLLGKNDIIVYSVGADYVGKANLYNSPVRAICGSSLTLIRPIQQIINPYYLLVFLNSSIGQLLTRRNLRGSVQQCIYPYDTKKIPIPMLDKLIQEQIETTVWEGEDAYNKSKYLLNIAKRAIEIAVEINEEAASDFIDAELQKFQ